MTTIRYDDLVESVAAALQYISFYHPTDYIAHLARAYEREESPAAKDAIARVVNEPEVGGPFEDRRVLFVAATASMSPDSPPLPSP